MNVTTTEEFVREAHKNACSEWKTKIENEFPDLFEKKIEVGRWYKDPLHGNVIYCSKITDDKTLYGYGFISGSFKVYEDEDADFCLYNYLSAKRLIEATHEEVKAALIAEAKKRYKDGDKVSRLDGYYYGDGNGIIKDIKDTKFFIDGPGLIVKVEKDYNHLIFKDGKWSEIIAEEKKVITKEKAEKILSKKYNKTVEIK